MEVGVLRCTEANGLAVSRVARGTRALCLLKRQQQRHQQAPGGQKHAGTAKEHRSPAARSARSISGNATSEHVAAEAKGVSERAGEGGGDDDAGLSVEEGEVEEMNTLQLEVELRSIADELLAHLGWLRVAVPDPEAGAAELRRQQEQEQQNKQQQRQPQCPSPHAILQAAQSMGVPPEATSEAVARERDGESRRGSQDMRGDYAQTGEQPEAETEEEPTDGHGRTTPKVPQTERKLRPRRGRTRASLEKQQQQQQCQPHVQQRKRRIQQTQRRRGSRAQTSPSQERLQQLVQITECNAGAAVAVSEALRKARAQNQQQQRHEEGSVVQLRPRLEESQAAANAPGIEDEGGAKAQSEGRAQRQQSIGRQGPVQAQQMIRRFAAIPPWLRDSVLTTTDPSKVKPFICLICRRGFGRGDLLHAHMQAHQDPAAFRCIAPGCAAAFATYGELQQHMQQPHDTDASTQDKKHAATTKAAASVPAAATRRSTRRSGLIASTHCNCGLTKHASKHDRCCVDDECPCVLKGVLCVACGCRNCHNKVARRKPGHTKAPKRS